jgi:Holliday junction resolvase RusA-like endonuclease
VSDRFSIFLPTPPSSRDVWYPAARPGIRKKTPKNVQGYGAMIITSDEQKEYKTAVEAAWRQKFGLQRPPLTGDVRVTVIWCRERRSGDLPNRTKCLYDALEKLAYENDKQIASERTDRIDGHLPAGVLVIIEPLHADQALEAREILDTELSAQAPRERPSMNILDLRPDPMVGHCPTKDCARPGEHRASECGIVTKAGRQE